MVFAFIPTNTPEWFGLSSLWLDQSLKVRAMFAMQNALLFEFNIHMQNILCNLIPN